MVSGISKPGTQKALYPRAKAPPKAKSIQHYDPLLLGICGSSPQICKLVIGVGLRNQGDIEML